MYILIYCLFTGVCIYSYIIFVYVYFPILCHVFFMFLIEKDENMCLYEY